VYYARYVRAVNRAFAPVGGWPVIEGWNYGDLWEIVADTLPDWEVLVQGERRLTWREVERRANGVAQSLLACGLGHQAKVAHFLYNCPEYLESTFAIFKVGLVPVNTNFRYRGEELTYLWNDADVEAVIFHATLTERVEEVRRQLPQIRAWFCVGDGPGCPPWATAYEAAVGGGASRFAPPHPRTPDDLILLYTGGTTGLPKGVIWRQDDVFRFMNSAAAAYPLSSSPDDVARLLRQWDRWVHLPPAPLMHAAGGWSSYGAMSSGGRVVLLASRKFDAVELLDAVDREQVNRVHMVGEAFARPILDALNTYPGRWHLSSLRHLSSTGAALSGTTRSALLAALPQSARFTEGLSSSEAVAMGVSVATRDDPSQLGKFTKASRVRVIDASGHDVTPGSGTVGMLYAGGIQPLGYYKDPEKTAKTFRVLDGQRYVVSGDYATVEADGTITFLGRGNVSINTGGEKVYPDEVERILLLHSAVADAAVIGISDARLGEIVCSLVRVQEPVTAEELILFVKSHLAGFKAPKRIIFVDAVPRHPNGKIDYRAAQREANLLMLR
jgi:3-oxocholest-4-en-26-oate---CoA ligase